MPDSPPEPPTQISRELATTLEQLTADDLEAVSQYATVLAKFKRANVETGNEKDGKEVGEDRPDEDRPDGVPNRATLTIKEINDNRYYYWQWREGEKIKSKYKEPVSPDE